MSTHFLDNSLAMLMGLPVRKLIAGVNENDIIHRCLLTGEFKTAESVVKSIAPSMDIQVPYNFERILYYTSKVSLENLLN